jgi:hypothetical protein
MAETATHSFMQRLVPALSRQRFALAAFLLPLGIRTIPEILVGAYPVGWDTVAFYVPNTLDRAGAKSGCTAIFRMAPLMHRSRNVNNQPQRSYW